jgi:hypothetical protein
VELVEKKHNLSPEQYLAMREMLEGLTPAERQTLKDPDFITEDEADLIVCDRITAEGGEYISLDELLAQNGIPRRRLSA